MSVMVLRVSSQEPFRNGPRELLNWSAGICRMDCASKEERVLITKEIEVKVLIIFFGF